MPDRLTPGTTCGYSPGALRNGAPFKDWVLPAATERIRRKLAGADYGIAAVTGGLLVVEAACAAAIAHEVTPPMSFPTS